MISHLISADHWDALPTPWQGGMQVVDYPGYWQVLARIRGQPALIEVEVAADIRAGRLHRNAHWPTSG